MSYGCRGCGEDDAKCRRDGCEECCYCERPLKDSQEDQNMINSVRSTDQNPIIPKTYSTKPQSIVTIRKDITNVLPNIRRHGLAVVEHIKYSGLYSRSYLRKVGLLPNKYRKPGLGWKKAP